ncbi:MAG TPA: chemotaxis protein CheB [Polyangiaceae bacterium]|nr:chemotaxis protein CheB [Polyangiaceae bacterium]
MTQRVIVIGGSAGSLSALGDVLRALPGDLAACVLCVRHSASTSAVRTDILPTGIGWELRVAVDRQPLTPGVVWIPPSDHHLLLDESTVRVLYGPRENNSRPSIDVLFRAAAVHHGPGVIAILLSGTMSDGVLGLSAVQRCGGVTIVQEPADAQSGELPKRAIVERVADHVLPAGRIADCILKLCAGSPAPAPPVPEDLRIEAKAAAFAMNEPAAIGPAVAEPVNVSCPDCGGPIWRMRGAGPDNYRCEVGHGYAIEELLRGQSVEIERALWVAFRTLKERAALLSEMIGRGRERAPDGLARSFEARRAELETHAESIRQILSSRSLYSSATTEPKEPG